MNSFKLFLQLSLFTLLSVKSVNCAAELHCSLQNNSVYFDLNSALKSDSKYAKFIDVHALKRNYNSDELKQPIIRLFELDEEQLQVLDHFINNIEHAKVNPEFAGGSATFNLDLPNNFYISLGGSLLNMVNLHFVIDSPSTVENIKTTTNMSYKLKSSASNLYAGEVTFASGYKLNNKQNNVYFKPTLGISIPFLYSKDLGMLSKFLKLENYPFLADLFVSLATGIELNESVGLEFKAEYSRLLVNNLNSRNFKPSGISLSLKINPNIKQLNHITLTGGIYQDINFIHTSRIALTISFL